MNISKELAGLGIRAHFIPQGKVACVDGRMFVERNVVVNLPKGSRPEFVAAAIVRHVKTVLGGASEITIRDTDTVLSKGQLCAYTAIGIKE